MPDFDKQIQKIEETKKMIRCTESKQRKYELHRHLNKLIKEYKRAKRYSWEAENKRRVTDERTKTSNI